VATFPRKYPHPTLIPSMPTRNRTDTPLEDLDGEALVQDTETDAHFAPRLTTALLFSIQSFADLLPHTTGAALRMLRSTAAFNALTSFADIFPLRSTADLLPLVSTADMDGTVSAAYLAPRSATATVQPYTAGATITPRYADADPVGIEREAEIFYE
jgi:hypothetical protein